LTAFGHVTCHLQVLSTQPQTDDCGLFEHVHSEWTASMVIYRRHVVNKARPSTNFPIRLL